MSLRTPALIAGGVGGVMLITGLIANAVRPDSTVDVAADVATAVVSVPPEVVATSPGGSVTVRGEGLIKARVARPVDAEAWLRDIDVTYVVGLSDWDALNTRHAAVVSPSPAPEVSPAATPEASPSPVSEEEVPEVTADYLERSEDIWRTMWSGEGSITLSDSLLGAGTQLVVMSSDGSPLNEVSITYHRNVNDGWITPLIIWGAVLTLIGLGAVVLRVIDLRPVQERTESWAARRNKSKATSKSSAAPAPGSRRERRLGKVVVPTVEINEDPTGPVAVETDAYGNKLGAEGTTFAPEPTVEAVEPPVASDDKEDK